MRHRRSDRRTADQSGAAAACPGTPAELGQPGDQPDHPGSRFNEVRVPSRDLVRLVDHLPGRAHPFGMPMIVSLEAIFLSTFVTISQNRADEKRQVLTDQQWLTVQDEEQQREAAPPVQPDSRAHQGHPRDERGMNAGRLTMPTAGNEQPSRTSDPSARPGSSPSPASDPTLPAEAPAGACAGPRLNGDGRCRAPWWSCWAWPGWWWRPPGCAAPPASSAPPSWP